MTANLDILTFALVYVIVWAVIIAAAAIREKTVLVIGGIMHFLFWVYLIVGNITVVSTSVTEGCNALTGVCTVTTTTTNLIDFVPIQDSSVPLGGMMGILMIFVSILCLYLYARS